jgi:CRP-like cAMP-binding protein/Fe-S-cluster-containing hydrogenase component 2/thioredoxin reductase
MAEYQIAIIGSGPAGLSAAAHAAERKMSYILLEKTDHLSDTIYCYQRGKHVMATPDALKLRADLPFSAGKREEILGEWQKRAGDLNVRFNAEVKSVTGSKGDFVVGLADGQSISAETIVLAIGTQGNPNLLSCEGAKLPIVQYQLADPAEYIDEHITVIGAGDAGIENARGLAEDAAQANVVTLINRSADLSKAKGANVAAVRKDAEDGKLTLLLGVTPVKIERGSLTLDTPEGQTTIRCDRVIARMGSRPPRKFVESMGVAFTSDAPDAYPQLSPIFESSAPGVFVIGALAGYPLIKHCINQGNDVIEYIAGNLELKGADQPILEERLAGLPGNQEVEDWIAFLRDRVEILNGLSILQMREYLLDAEVRAYDRGEVVFERREVGASLYGIASGSVLVEADPNDPSKTVRLESGSIFGEVGLISGRRRGSTVRTAEPCILIEIPRTTALKLMKSVKAANDTVERITTERQLLQIFGSGLQPGDIKTLLATAEKREVKPGEAIIEEGKDGYDVFVILSGSMVVEKQIGGKPIFLSYLPAGSYVGEVALVEGGRRIATVRAAIRSEVVRLDGDAFRLLINRKPELVAKLRQDMRRRREINTFIERQKDEFTGAVDVFTSVAEFMAKEGLGEATDVLLIDETLCIGCDNCEKACADAHDGLSRLDREAGRTYSRLDAGRTFSRLHVPTSCRHCERPYCMTDCPPNAIHRGDDGEVFIDDTCIGCGNCKRYCPYDVIQMDEPPAKKPDLFSWFLFGVGPGPGEPDKSWKKKHAKPDAHKVAIKCDMCSGKSGGPACVRACPTGAAIRVSPEELLAVAHSDRG